jgi:hypothetical protein
MIAERHEKSEFGLGLLKELANNDKAQQAHPFSCGYEEAALSKGALLF